MATTDASKQCAITNNSGKDIVITLAVLEQESTTSNSVVAANGGLELLKTTTGDTVIKNSSTASLTLDRNNKSGTNGDGYVKDYDLVVSDGNWIYPLLNLNVAQKTSGSTGVFDAVTVTNVKQNAMSQAFDFYQTIVSYPTSELVKSYMTAIQATKNAARAKADGSAGSAKAVVDAIDQTMGAFFKGTKAYQQVTVAEIFAVDSYFKNFPCIWAHYTDNITYFLYTSDGTTAGFAGTLSIKKSGPVDVSKANGGYACTFAPAITPSDTGKTDVDTSKTVNLVYTDGIFKDDINSATPKIALKGGFEVKKTFTYISTDTGVITIVIGKVNGQLCIGFDVPQISHKRVQAGNTVMATDDSDADSFWNSLIHPKTQLEILRATAVFLGAVAALILSAGIIFGIYKAIKAASGYLNDDDKETLTGDDLDKNVQEQEDFSDEDSGVYFTQCTDDPTFDRKKVDFNELKQQDALRQAKMDAGELLDGLQKQRESLETMLEFFQEINQQDYVDLLGAADDIKAANKSLSTADDANIEAILKTELSNYSTRQQKLTEIYKNVQKIIGEEAANKVAESLDLGERTSDGITDSHADEAKEEEDEDPILNDKFAPEIN